MKNINKNLSFPRFVVGNLPLSKSLLKEEKQRFFNGKVEDPRQKHSGMIPNFNNSAFTLIELLVVVLIIGILAAVAVPQYQFAVMKSRYAALKLHSNVIYNAVLRYHLANGNWPTRIDELDVDLPGEYMWGTYIFLPDGAACHLWYDGNGNNGYVGCARTEFDVRYRHSFQENSGRFCQTPVSGEKADLRNKLCKQETHDDSPAVSNGTAYYNYKD